VNSYLLSIEMAKSINRERREEAENHRLARLAQAGQPNTLDRAARRFGKLVVALALALRLR
jgi:hypothetical protein